MGRCESSYREHGQAAHLDETVQQYRGVQLANSLMKKWHLARAVTMQIDSIAFSVSRRTAELREANERLRANIVGRAADLASAHSHNGIEATFRQKEEFLAIMSHEILTPMNELVRKVHLLLDSPLSPGQREHATTLQRCAEDLLSLINDMHVFMAGGRQETQT